MRLLTQLRWQSLARLCFGVLLLILAGQHFYKLFEPKPLIEKLSELPALQSLPKLDLATIGSPQVVLAEVRGFTRLVYDNTDHCEVSDLRLSWVESLLAAVNPFSNMFQQGILVRQRFQCGYCHQRSFLLLELLQERFGDPGVSPRLFGLNGHVVLQFEVLDRNYVADPDYGVGPFEYHAEDLALSDEITTTYVGVNNLKQLLSLYLSRNDNAPYSTVEGFNLMKTKQHRWFLLANVLGGFFLILGCAFLWSFLRAQPN